MKKILLSTLLCSSMMFAANSDYKYEITPMIGGAYTEGNLNLDRNYANFGLGLGFNLEDSMFDQIELGILRTLQSVDYENNTGSTSITRIFTNVIKEYPLTDKTALYALVGAGAEIYGNNQYNNKDGLFANYGFGYKYTFDNDMALKFDLRHLIEFDHADNNLLYTIGLAIPFGKKTAEAPAQPVIEEKVVTDSDADGVEDALDKCPTSAPKDVVDANGCVIVVDLKVDFFTNKASIKPQFNEKITKFAEYLKANPELKATLGAHTDSVGDAQYNLSLSQKRAASVKQALVNLGIEASRIDTIGYGETKPIADNGTPAGRAQNRRVEATVSK